MSKSVPLQESLTRIRKCIQKSRFAFRKAETLVLIQKHPYKAGGFLVKPSFPLRYHVYFGEQSGSSMFLAKVLQKYKTKRIYYDKEFYKYIDRKQNKILGGRSGPK